MLKLRLNQVYTFGQAETNETTTNNKIVDCYSNTQIRRFNITNSSASAVSEKTKNHFISENICTVLELFT